MISAVVILVVLSNTTFSIEPLNELSAMETLALPLNESFQVPSRYFGILFSGSSIGGAQANAGRRSNTTNLPSLIGQPLESNGTSLPVVASMKGRDSFTTSQKAGGLLPTSTPMVALLGGGGNT